MTLLDERFQKVEEARGALAKAVLYGSDTEVDWEAAMVHINAAKAALEGIS